MAIVDSCVAAKGKCSCMDIDTDVYSWKYLDNITSYSPSQIPIVFLVAYFITIYIAQMVIKLIIRSLIIYSFVLFTCNLMAKNYNIKHIFNLTFNRSATEGKQQSQPLMLCVELLTQCFMTWPENTTLVWVWITCLSFSALLKHWNKIIKIDAKKTCIMYEEVRDALYSFK